MFWGWCLVACTNFSCPRCLQNINGWVLLSALRWFDRVLLHLSGDRLEVVQIALLMPRGQLSKQGPATIHQVRPSFVEISRQHKELLLPTQVAAHGLKVKGRKWKPWFIKSLVTNFYYSTISFFLRLAGIRTEASAGFRKPFTQHLQQMVAAKCFRAKPLRILCLDSLIVSSQWPWHL